MDYYDYSIIKIHFPSIFNFGIIAILLKSLEYSTIIKNNRNSMCSRGAECTPHIFFGLLLIIPYYSWLFLIIPDYSYRFQGHYYSDYCRLFLFFLDYSDNSQYSDYCQTMKLLYACLTTNLWCCRCAWRGQHTTTHRKSFPYPHAPSPAWFKRLYTTMLFYSLDYCDYCNYSVHCDYWNSLGLFRLLQTLPNNKFE